MCCRSGCWDQAVIRAARGWTYRTWVPRDREQLEETLKVLQRRKGCLYSGGHCILRISVPSGALDQTKSEVLKLIPTFPLEMCMFFLQVPDAFRYLNGCRWHSICAEWWSPASPRYCEENVANTEFKKAWTLIPKSLPSCVSFVYLINGYIKKWPAKQQHASLKCS